MKLTREQLAQRTAKDRYRVKRLAETVAGSGVLYRPEAQALTFVADTQTMRDGLCDKALARCDEKGYSRKQVQCGLHGYTRKGKREFPGLLERHIVYIVGEASKGGLRPGGYGGLTTAYAVDVDVLLTYVSDVPPEPNMEANVSANPSANVSANMEANVSANVSANLAHTPTSISSSLSSLSLKNEKREREEVKLPAAAQTASAEPTAKSSPSPSGPSGEKPAQERRDRDIDVDSVITRVKDMAHSDKHPEVQFNKQAKIDLSEALQKLTAMPQTVTWLEIERAVRVKLATCKNDDKTAWDIFGSQFAANLVSSVSSYRNQHKKKVQHSVQSVAVGARLAAIAAKLGADAKVESLSFRTVCVSCSKTLEGQAIDYQRSFLCESCATGVILWSPWLASLDAAINNLENLDSWCDAHPVPTDTFKSLTSIHGVNPSTHGQDAWLPLAKKEQDVIRRQRERQAATAVGASK